MLKSNYSWKLNNKMESLQMDELENYAPVEKMILNRGLATKDTLETFLNQEEISYDPFLFSQMEQAVKRIQKAIEAQEPILIYGDYDADGVTGTSILMRCLRELGALVNFYIPNRFYEGYGPNEDAFMQAIGEGYKLIITVDNGISGIEEADLLTPYGVDLIITDHHQPKEILPIAFSIIHPEIDEAYPFKKLAGAGVALKLAQALLGEELSDDYYAIAVLGTIGDVVLLMDENRSIVKRGLKALRETSLAGLTALMEKAGISQLDLDEVNVGFEICPRLNAPGRMDEASLAVELLITDDNFEALELADQIESLNIERQKVTQKVIEQAQAQVTEDMLETKKVIVLHDANWHEGILGIVAGRLSKQWQKAVFVLTDDHEGFVKGSARAVEGIHLFDLLSESMGLIKRFGGHALAAGITLLPENIQALEDQLNESLKEVSISKTQSVDLELPLSNATLEFIDDLSQLAPFGEGNRPPVFLFKDVKVKNVKQIGNKLQHLKFTIYQDDHQIEAIAFNQAPLFIYLTPETNFDFVGELKINEWNGKRTVQFHFIDVQCEEFQLIDLRNKQSYEQNKGYLTAATSLTDNKENLEMIGTLIIDQLPENKGHLERVLKTQKPGNVVLAPLPTEVTFAPRDKFVTVYKIIKQHGPVVLNDQVYSYFMRLGITKNQLLFILQVFFEVELVIIRNGSVFATDQSNKRDLSEAPTFKSQKSKLEMLEFFELQTWNQLKTTFIKAREEMTHES